jgi:5,10-methylenetetrahydromethanopterin reductase
VTRLALYLQDAHPIRDAMGYAAYAEERGFEAVWQADSRLVREASVPMAAFAATTDTIKVGSGVVDCWTRNPARLASVFSTLDDLAPGRIILGIGAWWDPLASKVGIERARPLTVMREVVEAVRALLANETVTYHGEHVHLDGVELDYVHQERRPKDVPIYIGATGMQMMELTGEIADGVVLNYLVSPDYNAGPWSTWPPAPSAPAARSTTSTARSWSCAPSTTTARPRSTAPGCSSPSTWVSSRTS